MNALHICDESRYNILFYPPEPTSILPLINTYQTHKSGKLPDEFVEISAFALIGTSSRSFSISSA
jgi:hypothetical protein